MAVKKILMLVGDFVEDYEVMDFSQPFYATGLGIAVPARDRGGILPSIVQRLLSSHGGDGFAVFVLAHGDGVKAFLFCDLAALG